MKIQTYDIGTWLYPDSEITECREKVALDSARNGDACFQVLTDISATKGTKVDLVYITPCEGVKIRLYELRPVLVKYNSGAVNYNAIDWENIKDFAVRRAPYEVYDLTREIEDGTLWGDTGKTAFLVRLDVAEDVNTGEKELEMKLQIGEEEAKIQIRLRVHKAVLSNPGDSPYPMAHWIIPGSVCYSHKVERFSEEYYHYVEQYLKQMIEMRSNHIQLPTPIPVRDEDGKVVDFDFTECDRYTEMALRLGFRYINSGFIAIWKVWQDSKYYLHWDVNQEVESMEAYRQLQIYFTRTKEFIERHHIQDKYWQSFVDEPQLANSMAYKSLACTCRRFIPNVRIMDPVETPSVAGSCDIWVVKQEVYEQYKEEYDKLMEMGEKMWVYTCGFPANKWMNHVIDLPLAATRLVIWEGIKRGLDGFLHYGYHDYEEGMDPMYDTNFGRIYKKEMRYFPPGNNGIVYTDGKKIYDSVRAHVQRISAAEGELFLRLREKDRETCNAIIARVCDTFKEYISDSEKIESARKELFNALDKMIS